MILYHPATDFFHCWMRIATMVDRLGNDSIEYDRARIIDYYLCFPHALLQCRLPASFSNKVRKSVHALDKRYEDDLSIHQAFQQMRAIQHQVVMDMVGRGLLERTAYLEGLLVVSDSSQAHDVLVQVTAKWSGKESEARSTIIDALGSLSLNGHNGLKARSGLLEYRYDQ